MPKATAKKDNKKQTTLLCFFDKPSPSALSRSRTPTIKATFAQKNPAHPQSSSPQAPASISRPRPVGTQLDPIVIDEEDGSHAMPGVGIVEDKEEIVVRQPHRGNKRAKVVESDSDEFESGMVVRKGRKTRHFLPPDPVIPIMTEAEYRKAYQEPSYLNNLRVAHHDSVLKPNDRRQLSRQVSWSRFRTSKRTNRFLEVLGDNHVSTEVYKRTQEDLKGPKEVKAVWLARIVWYEGTPSEEDVLTLLINNASNAPAARLRKNTNRFASRQKEREYKAMDPVTKKEEDTKRAAEQDQVSKDKAIRDEIAVSKLAREFYYSSGGRGSRDPAHCYVYDRGQ